MFALRQSAERGRARLRRVGATCAGATNVKRPPRTIPSRRYATLSLRETVERRRRCLAFYSWCANTRVSWRRSVIGMMGCSAADRGLCALKRGVCTVLTELQAKHVTPFAHDGAATFRSNFPGRARIDRAKRHDGQHPCDWEWTFTRGTHCRRMRGNHCRRMTRLLGRRRLETHTTKDDTDTCMRGERR